MNIEKMARAAKEASRRLATASTAEKNRALRAMAAELRRAKIAILRANAREVAAARKAGLSSAFVDRLTLDPVRLEKIARGVEKVAELSDPVGETSPFAMRPAPTRVSIFIRNAKLLFAASKIP